jgi:hypothetical protein
VGYSITSHPESCYLIIEQVFVVGVAHSVNIFDNEALWANVPQCPIKLSVKIINFIFVISSSALAVALARVASSQNICVWELLEITNVSALDHSWFYNSFIQFAGGLMDFVCPDRLNACRL